MCIAAARFHDMISYDRLHYRTRECSGWSQTKLSWTCLRTESEVPNVAISHKISQRKKKFYYLPRASLPWLERKREREGWRLKERVVVDGSQQVF